MYVIYHNFEKFLAYKALIPEQQHVFVVLTVPIHYPDANIFNKLLDVTHHGLIDDVRDHYSATIHRFVQRHGDGDYPASSFSLILFSRREQARVLNDLATFCTSAHARSRATILSGDVHLAAFTTSEVRFVFGCVFAILYRIVHTTNTHALFLFVLSS